MCIVYNIDYLALIWKNQLKKRDEKALKCPVKKKNNLQSSQLDRHSRRIQQRGNDEIRRLIIPKIPFYQTLFITYDVRRTTF